MHLSLVVTQIALSYRAIKAKEYWRLGTGLLLFDLDTPLDILTLVRRPCGHSLIRSSRRELGLWGGRGVAGCRPGLGEGRAGAVGPVRQSPADFRSIPGLPGGVDSRGCPILFHPVLSCPILVLRSLVARICLRSRSSAYMSRCFGSLRPGSIASMSHRTTMLLSTQVDSAVAIHKGSCEVAFPGCRVLYLRREGRIGGAVNAGMGEVLANALESSA